MADVVFTVDTDTKQAVAKNEGLKKSFKSVGDGMAQTGKQMEQAVKQTGASIEKTVLNMGRLVAGAKMALHAFNAMGQSVHDFQEKAGQAAATRGGLALRTSQAAAEGGLNQKLVSNFLANQTGAATQEEKAALIEKIAKEQPDISNQRFIEVTSALSSGAFSSGRIDEALKSGESLNVAEQRGKLSADALAEIDTRQQINMLNAQSQGGRGANIFRVAGAAIEAEDRRDPLKAGLRSILPSALTQPAQDFKAIQLALETQKSKMNMTGVTDNQ